MATAISVDALRKSFGDREVISGVSFEVGVGECFGLLGHNGAGKTVTVEILEGYLKRDGGTVSVLGTDPAQPTRSWRERIGVVLQEVELLPTLTVRETVSMFADLYSNPRPVEETIELVGLSGMERARISGLSGGERRRVDVALGIIGNPELLFLDEPTTGFDPAARRGAWRMIEDLKGLGVTILLTTHYMDEAEALADLLLILKHGEVVATGTYDELVRAHGSGTTISFQLPAGVTAEAVRAATDVDIQVDGTLATVSSDAPQRDLYRLTGWAEGEGVVLGDLSAERASLEDVFLKFGEAALDDPAASEQTAV